MKPLSLDVIASAVNGQLQGAPITVDVVFTDTRTIATMQDPARALFIAIKGEIFDAHSFLQNAYDLGIRAAIVSELHDIGGLSQIVVKDTQRALADLATYVQQQRSVPVIAITGSNGKTSVKTLTQSILEGVGRTYATPGNRNNEIGMPLAVLSAPEDIDFAVYEMGTGKPGDIAYLTRIARPSISLVNNVAPAHIERMGSTLAIADTKAAVYDDLRTPGVAVINADDSFGPYFSQRSQGHQIIRFGLINNADVTAENIRAQMDRNTFDLISPLGRANDVRIQFPGEHNVMNALAAAAIALGAGATLEQIVAGLSKARPIDGRLVALQTEQGAVLVDDSYNANPGSMAAAIKTLTQAAQQQNVEAWLVMGDMRELGDDARAMHEQVGRMAHDAGVDRLYVLGALSEAAADAFAENSFKFASHQELAAQLHTDLHAGVRVLVKGSRGSAMEKIVHALVRNEKSEGHSDAA